MQRLLDWLEQKGMQYIGEERPITEEDPPEKLLERILESDQADTESIQYSKKLLTNYYFYAAGELQINISRKEQFFEGLNIEKSFWEKYVDSLPYVVMVAGRFNEAFDCQVDMAALESKIETNDASIDELLERVQPGYRLERVFEEEKAKRVMKEIIYYYHRDLVNLTGAKMERYRTELENLLFECMVEKYKTQKEG